MRECEGDSFEGAFGGSRTIAPSFLRAQSEGSRKREKERERGREGGTEGERERAIDIFRGHEKKGNGEDILRYEDLFWKQRLKKGRRRSDGK